MAARVNSTAMKLKFPEFANVPPATIEFAIAEAALGVGANWIDDENRMLGQMYLAGHYLMVSIQRSESATGQKIKSERIGADFSVTYADDNKQAIADPNDFTTTVYGSRYLSLLQANIPAIAII